MSALPVRLFLATKALIQHQGLVLILRESNKYVDGVQEGKFDVPGGRITPGEHFLDSLRREVMEESGLTIQNINLLFINEVRVPKQEEEWQIVRTFYTAESSSNQVTLSDDHCEYQWIDPKNYRDYPIIENLTPVFEAYLSGKAVL
jgi:8-oxo-dGTP diphosphatase